MGIKIKNLQTGEFEKFNIPALKGEKGEPGEIELSEKVDYIGKQHSKLRDTMNANVDYIIKTAIGEFNYLDYEGQYITATNSIEGHAKSAILKGNTLVNVIDEISFHSSANHYFYVDLKQYEINKDYLFMIFNAPQEITKVYFGNSASTIVWRGYTSDFVRNGSTISLKVTCPSNYDGSKILPHFSYGSSQPSLDEVKQMKVMLIPYQQGMENWDIPYFEGMQSVRMPVLKTTGSNMVNPADIKVIGCNSYDVDSDGIVNVVGDTTGYWARSYIIYTHHLKGNTTYYIYCNGDSTGTIKAEGWVDNINSGRISWNNFYEYTPETDVLYEAKIFLNTDASPFTCSKIRIGIFESTTKPSSYEPYKSNILSTPEEVELRGIGVVKDELNLLTGELTERIGEVVLDGAEDWAKSSSSDTTCLYAVSVRHLNRKIGVENVFCDKFITMNTYNTNTDKESIFASNSNPTIYIRINKNKLSSDDLTGFKQYLQSNPTTVQYQLATESIKTVDLSNQKVYSYDGTTHYTCSSEEGSLIPTLSVKVPTDTQLTIQEQKATTQTLLIKNMDLQQSIKEVQAMNLAFNTALYNSFNSIREEVEDIKKHVSTNENLEGSF